MSDSVRVLLADSIDYAGIFPPAKLALADALHNYVQYSRLSESWMLGRFVCPAALLPGLGALATDLPFLQKRGRLTRVESDRVRQLVAEQLGIEPAGIPASFADMFREWGADSLDTAELVMELEEEFDIRISDNPQKTRQLVESLAAFRKNTKHPVTVVATAVANVRDCVRNFEQDICALVAFRRSSGEQLRVESLEVKLPSDAVDPPHSELATVIGAVRRAVAAAELESIRIFFEIPLGRDWQRSLTRLINVLADCPAEQVALKVRTGGPDAKAIPSAEQFALFIAACRRSNVPWKATAGLHSPFRPKNDGGENCPYGFLNVLVASVLATTHRLEPADIVPILNETDARAFKFAHDSFCWGRLRATIPQIEQARRTSIQSFGSCSFDEPRDGIRELMLIP